MPLALVSDWIAAFWEKEGFLVFEATSHTTMADARRRGPLGPSSLPPPELEDANLSREEKLRLWKLWKYGDKMSSIDRDKENVSEPSRHANHKVRTV